VNRHLHERDLRIAQINSEYENIQHRFKVEVANHKIDLAKTQRDQIERQEQLNTHIQGSSGYGIFKLSAKMNLSFSRKNSFEKSFFLCQQHLKKRLFFLAEIVKI
jgi:hypothetical protein